MSKNKADEWKFKRSYDFYTDLGMRESTGQPEAKNKTTKYIGLYQMGEAALVDAGYYTKEPTKADAKPSYNNDWTGTWTGKNGINSKDDFLANRQVQDVAVYL